MVYGLNVKPEGGSYPKVEPLDGFDAPIPALEAVNDGGPGWSGRHGGVPVDGTHFPKRVRWSDADADAIPDFGQVPELHVSDDARRVIESLEPGVHQFFPVDFVDPGDRLLARRFWLVVCNRIDGMDRARTTMVLRKGVVWRPAKDLARRGEPLPDGVDPKAPARIVFSQQAIGDAHLWVDKHMDGPAVWISDTAARRFTEAGLTGLRLDNPVEAY